MADKIFRDDNDCPAALQQFFFQMLKVVPCHGPDRSQSLA